MLTGENGILTQATSAKEKTDKSTEEEKIQMAVLGSSIIDNGYADILDEKSFKNELANQFGSQSLNVVANGDGSFIITIEDTQRKYYVNDDKIVINSDNIIEISTAEELASFRDDVNNGNSYEGKAVLLISDITLSGNWTPIGAYSEETQDNHYLDVPVNKPFRGIFDGCNHKINNLQIDNTEYYQGLFGLVIDGTIRDITIAEGSSITASKRSGTLVGCLYGFRGNIYNCVNYANGSMNGGIVGMLIGQHKVSNCKNYGNITRTDASDSTGGIVGTCNGIADWPEEFANYSHKIINCINYGKLTVESGNFCGGISGYFNGQMIECSNEGEIDNVGMYTGGIVGYFNREVLNCSNKGEVNSRGVYTGGIAGFIEGTIKNCYNTKDISGENGVGGICGTIYDSGCNIINCYSLGNVNGSISVGNIVGWKNEAFDFKIVNCYTQNDTFTAEDLGDAFIDNPENANQPLLYWEVEENEDESY